MSDKDNGPGRLRPAFARAWSGLMWATPGQVDAGLSSLATFIVGIFAIRELTPEGLGAYGLLLAAFHLASQVPAELLLTPAQIVAIDRPVTERLGMIRHSLPRGLVLSSLAAVAVPLGALPVAGTVDAIELVPLAISVAVLTALSPLQDHLRSMYHLSGRSWMAAAMSATHLLATTGALFALSAARPAFAPFGALAIGNATSLLVGGIGARNQPASASPPRLRQLTSIGSWLIATGLTKNGLGYAGRALLNALVGTAALGFVEGARVVSQPINVLALGLMAQVGPRSTEAGAQRNRALARRWRLRFGMLLAGAGLPYFLLTAFPWAINPLFRLAPRAYEVGGLTAAMLIATLVSCLVRPVRSELLGARRQRDVTQITVVAGAVETALIFGAFALGLFVVPLGLGVGSLFALVLYMRRIAGIYTGEEPTRPRTFSPT